MINQLLVKKILEWQLNHDDGICTHSSSIFNNLSGCLCANDFCFVIFEFAKWRNNCHFENVLLHVRVEVLDTTNLSFLLGCCWSEFYMAFIQCGPFSVNDLTTSTIDAYFFLSFEQNFNSLKHLQVTDFRSSCHTGNKRMQFNWMSPDDCTMSFDILMFYSKI